VGGGSSGKLKILAVSVSIIYHLQLQYLHLHLHPAAPAQVQQVHALHTALQSAILKGGSMYIHYIIGQGGLHPIPPPLAPTLVLDTSRSAR
jgi:hypothetical protein